MSFMNRTGRGFGKMAVTAALTLFATAALCGHAIAANSEIGTWTFESSAPGGAGCSVNAPVTCLISSDISGITPESGAGTALGHHANASTVWSNPAGNGSTESWSDDHWGVGDYYQFQVSTSGLSNIGLQFDQVSSTTGPRDFKLQYSTDGTSFTDFASYMVQPNGGPAWGQTAVSPLGLDTFSFDLSSITGLNNLANIYFRITDTSTASANNTGTVPTTGTDRLDNFSIFSSFDATQPPIIQPPAPPVLPQGNDVILGLDGNRGKTTLDLVRGAAVANGGAKPAPYAPWQNVPFVGSNLAFDNTGGTAHNVHGNLLAVDQGASATAGGRIINLATTGSAPFASSQVLATTAGNRLGQLAVSPSNNKIAVAGADNGQVTVWDYTPGNTQGSGASLTGMRSTTTSPLAPVNGTTPQAQGVAWVNNNTVLSLSTTGNLFETDSTAMTTTAKGSVTLAMPGLVSATTALSYNTAISPYVWAMYGGFNPALGNSINTLYVLDPANNYNVLHTVNLTGTTTGGVTTPPGAVPTANAIAFDSAGDLFISGNASIISVIPSAAANALTLADFSAQRWYTSTTFENFTGLDIGLAAVTPPGVQGDYNGNGVVDAADYVVWRSSVGQATLLNRGTGITGNVGPADYTFWKSRFGSTSGSGSGLGGSSVPEPSSALLLMLGLAAFCGKRRAA